MQELTDVLLKMESERSTWIAKEKAYLEAKKQLDIRNDDNIKLSEDLMKVPSIEFIYVSVPIVPVTYLPDLIHYQSISVTISLPTLCGYLLPVLFLNKSTLSCFQTHYEN